MQRPLIAAASLSAAAIVALAASALAQQGQLQLPGGGLKPPPPPPVRPYQQVAVTPPAPFDDPSFVAFRKQLADVVAHKDRAALAKLVVTQNFFWFQDKDLADKRKSGIDNLAKAIDLDAKGAPGWDTLAEFADEPSAAESPQQRGTYCAPADPGIDAKAFVALGQATGTDPSDWAYPSKDGIDVRAAAPPNAPVIEKLGSVLFRVLPDSGQQDDPNQPLVLHVATPSGKTGFVDAAAVAPLVADEICYAKDAGGWKIVGYLGGVAQ
ncbi:MAG TPA: hypothetical protein VEK75_11500 [Xanthobacteraceae bacterium]|nr:hypothetical protein [Xanthobacteraceae bacterium]